MNLYETLGVDANATPDDIKKAYKKAAQKTHPDRVGGDLDQFKKVQHAYEVLSDPDKRKFYDTNGVEPGVGHSDQQIVQSAISQIFALIIDNYSGGDIVETAREMVMAKSKDIEKTKRKAQSSLETLEKLKDRVVVNDDSSNYFEMLIQGRINKAEAQIKHSEFEERISALVIEALEHYIDKSPEEKQQLWNGSTTSSVFIR